MVIGIDASNIREGGGITHLKELILALNNIDREFENVFVYSSSGTLNKIPDFPWLVKSTSRLLNGNFLTRLLWQWIVVPGLVRKDISILFNPGSTFIGGFHPYVSMCRNMLVFDKEERKRYGKSLVRLRLKLLNFLQRRCFKDADGVIFLSKYAQEIICSKVKCDNYEIIPHGISDRFRQRPKEQKLISLYTKENPFIILYVSIIDVYKHQWKVAKAIAMLKENDGFAVELHLVGSHYPPSLNQLNKQLSEIKNYQDYIILHGKVDFEKIEKFYKQADLFVFASTCENMPNIVIEAMSAGLPISSSFAAPMPEFLQDAADYFDSENPDSIYQSLKNLILKPKLRASLAEKAFIKSLDYSWNKCAVKTINFLNKVSKQNKI